MKKLTGQQIKELVSRIIAENPSGILELPGFGRG
jgi:hypothetical protein